VFQSTRQGRTDIWAIGERRGFFKRAAQAPIQLTHGPLNFSRPAPGRDGKKLFALGAEPRGELVRYDSKSKQFLPYLSGISAEGVSFSKDGQWVAYTAYPYGTLWRSKVDGGDRLQLTSVPMRAFLPRWSPDGKRIAFMGAASGKPWQVYVVSSDGGGLQQLTTGENHGDPNWSPDGNTLVFDRLPYLEARGPNSANIYLLDLRTHQVSTLAGSEGQFYSPLWSPDARYITAQTGDSQKQVIFDFGNKRWADLVDMPMAYASWSRDGKYLYFETFLGKEPNFFRIRVNDRKLEKLFSLKGIRQTLGTFGPWSGLAPDDSCLLLREIGSQEIYALDVEFP